MHLLVRLAGKLVFNFGINIRFIIFLTSDLKFYQQAVLSTTSILITCCNKPINSSERRVDLVLGKERGKLLSELKRSQLIGENLEAKLSSIKEECVDLKEKLNRAILEKEVIEQEKSHLSEVLSKAELSKAEVEMEMNRVKTEELALKDALIKLQSLNEALGMDKVELTRIIRHMELEKDALGNEKNEIEQEKISIREELIRVEQEKVSRGDVLGDGDDST